MRTSASLSSALGAVAGFLARVSMTWPPICDIYRTRVILKSEKGNEIGVKEQARPLEVLMANGQILLRGAFLLFSSPSPNLEI